MVGQLLIHKHKLNFSRTVLHASRGFGGLYKLGMGVGSIGLDGREGERRGEECAVNNNELWSGGNEGEQ